MASPFIGLSSAARGRERLYPYKCNSAGLKEGAAFMFDGSANGQLVKAPTGPAVPGVAGVLADVQNAATGSVVGTDVNLQKDGIGNVLLQHGQTCHSGDPLVVADVDGSLRVLNTGTDDGGDIVAYAEVTRTAGSTNELIPARIEITRYKA